MNKKNNYLWLNTGIDDLNDLLTRTKKNGFCVPYNEGFASSITIIKGPAGAGKSVLSSIISHNIHGKTIKIDEFENMILFAVYFSYTQNAEGLYRYIDEIVPNKVKIKKTKPIILSKKPNFGKSISGGIDALRRSLIETLSPFRESDLMSVNSGNKYDLKSKINNVYDSEFWNLGTKKSQLKIDSVLSLIKPKDIYIPFVIVDPINYFFDYRDSREAVANLFSSFRELKWPLLLTLEDVGPLSRAEHRQLCSYAEFEADTVIQLNVDSTGHIRKTIEVTKSRNAQPRFGRQMYRIEKPKHGFSNIMEKDHSGFMIFPSIHWVLSHSYLRPKSEWGCTTGMECFDRRLPKESIEGRENITDKNLLPRDALLVVRGEKGAHKLPMSFNLLVSGLWDPSHSGNVLLISLGEEMNLSLDHIALCKGINDDSESKYKNNGDVILDWGIPQNKEFEKEKPNFKVSITKWPVQLHNNINKTKYSLIEATFKPGYLMPDEFLLIIETLIQNYKPTRILIENTSHLQMRFPDLHDEKMLFPALSSITRSKGIMLIITDVQEKGYDEELSYGLATGADIVIDVSSISEEEHKNKDFEKIRNKIENLMDKETKKDFVTTWSKMTLSNVRAKDYRRSKIAGTVIKPGGDYKSRFMLNDVTKIFTFSKIMEQSQQVN